MLVVRAKEREIKTGKETSGNMKKQFLVHFLRVDYMPSLDFSGSYTCADMMICQVDLTSQLEKVSLVK